MTACSCHHDPRPGPVLTACPSTASRSATSGRLGYARRDASLGPRCATGAQLVRTCTRSMRPRAAPTTAPSSATKPAAPPPRTLLELASSRPHDATPGTSRCTRPADRRGLSTRYKLGRITSDDADGYHRVACPANTQARSAAPNAASIGLGPEAAAGDPHPPESTHARRRCQRQTIWKIPPDVASKTRQKHDYPSRRTGGPPPGAPAPSPDLRHHPGPARQQHRPRLDPADGLAPFVSWLACLLAVRNQRIPTATGLAAAADDARRATAASRPRPASGAAGPARGLAATAAPP
jgi:hypothetical protein